MSKALAPPKHKKAAKELSRQKGIAAPEDLELAAEGISVDTFLVDVAKLHHLKVNFAESITEGYVERSIEGASVISITVHDGTREILRSGMFGTDSNEKLPAIDVKVEGIWYRLASFQKNEEELTLEFEDRIVAFLKSHTKPISASRAHTTRAEFIGRMVREVRATKIRYFCPELHRKQPIEGQGGVEGYTVDKKTGKRRYKSKKRSERERKAELSGGLLTSTTIKVKGVEATKSQLQILEEILDTGSEMSANRKVLISSIMCVIQESDVSILHDPATGEGPFSQIPADGWPGGSDVPSDARAYFKEAINNDKANPSLTLAELVQSVQKSGAGASHYAPWRQEAEEILKEYGEKGIAAQHGGTYTKEYDFHRGPPDGPTNENSWEASERLAKEVNWRRFVVGNTFYFVQDHDLIHRKPTAEIDEDTEGIESINGTVDAGIPVNEAVVKCRATRWWAPPGSVIKVKNTGPLNGRWLVFNIHRDLFSEETEVKLHQPEAAKPEKASEKVQVQKSGEGQALILGSHISGGTPRARIVEAAKWGLEHKPEFRYLEYRPMAKSLFEKFALTHTDCSAFATLCYKAANVKDPNGNGYNGSGNTVSLRAHGNKTNNPQPGDLVFYRSPEHVAVYIGEGKVIELGGTPGPNEEPIHYRNDLLECRSYNLEEEAQPSPKPGPRGEPPTPQVLTKKGREERANPFHLPNLGENALAQATGEG